MSLTGIEVGDHDNKWAITLQTTPSISLGPKKQMYNFWGETQAQRWGSHGFP